MQTLEYEFNRIRGVFNGGNCLFVGSLSEIDVVYLKRPLVIIF